MVQLQDIIFIVGRVLYGGFFIMLGGSYLRNIARLVHRARLKRVPYPTVFIALCTAFSVLGGVGVMLGFNVNLSLGAIFVATLLSSFKMHDYWNESDPERIPVEMSHFIKNMALLGATLMMYSILQPWNLSL